MVKLLFLIHDLGQGGAEKVLVNLVNNMDQTKFSITVISLFAGGENESLLKPHIRYKTIFKKAFPGNSHIMKLFSPKFLHKLFVREHYDIEIAYLEGPSARIISGCKAKNTKLLSWIHCTMHSLRDIAAPFRNAAEAKQCYNRFDSIVYVSESCREAFQKYCKTDGKNIVLYNTNDSDIILEKAKHIPDVMKKSTAFKWCGVGKIIPVKAFDRMLRIQKKLIESGYDVHLYILGNGPLKNELQDWCRSNKIDESVTFLGYQSNPYQYVAHCDLFVCSSLSEGFSTAATEALIVGTPVCSVEVSGMKEMLGENNEYGVVVPNDEDELYCGIKKLMDNPQLLKHYKNQATLRGACFSTPETVSAVERNLLQL